MNSGVLLESGTNELEILEFKLGENYYGINVAKIREILPYKKPTAIPNVHKSIEGIFMPRDLIITIVSLAKCLNVSESKNEAQDMIIVTNFNKLNLAFHVHGVVGIHRVSWQEMTKPDNAFNTIATGIIKLQGKLIVVLDVEKIITEISPETGLKMSDMDHLENRSRNESPILLVEDSPLLNNLITEFLHKSGYSNIITTNNGQEALDKLNEFKNNKTLDKNVKCIITDIEMPQMDGHYLTKTIKNDPDMQHIPVIVFSSLINDEMRIKGESVGADAQISKPEIARLVETVDELIQL